MNKSLFFLILALATMLLAQEQDKQTRFPVKYLSAEYVYLDGGKAKGLNPGDQLAVVRGKDRVIAKIEVVFAADFSASCKVVFSREDIKPGDVAMLIEQKPETPAEAPEPEATEEPSVASDAPAPKPAEARKSQKSARVSGSASLQYFHLNDLTGAGLDFSQPTFRISLRARTCGAKTISFACAPAPAITNGRAAWAVRRPAMSFVTASMNCPSVLRMTKPASITSSEESSPAT